MFDQLGIVQQRNQVIKATLTDERYGSDGFHKKIAKRVTRVINLSSHGGDWKSDEYKNQAGSPFDTSFFIFFIDVLNYSIGFLVRCPGFAKISK